MGKFHKMYGIAWQKARVSFLKDHPFCAKCGKPLRGGDAVVDHIIPHKGNWSLFWDKNNWQALCKHCHDSEKQMEEHGRISAGGFDTDGFPVGAQHPWNKEE